MQEDWFAVFWFAVFKFRATVRAYLIRYDCFCHIAELLILLQPNLIGWYIIINWSALCKNQIVVFKVKITVKVQNFIESFCLISSVPLIS